MVDPDGTGGTSRLPNSDTRTHPRTQRIECFGVSRNRRFVAVLQFVCRCCTKLERPVAGCR